jgi:hypothetical protein
MKIYRDSLIIILFAFIVLLSNLSYGANNQKFYGTYELTLTIADCPSYKYTFTIGDNPNSNLMLDDNKENYFLHLNITDTKNIIETIVIDGRNLFITNARYDIANDYYSYIEYTKTSFSNNYKKAKITGRIYYSNPDYCSGTMKGTLIKKK